MSPYKQTGKVTGQSIRWLNESLLCAAVKQVTLGWIKVDSSNSRLKMKRYAPSWEGSRTQDCREKFLTMSKLTGLQIADFHRQLEGRDIIRSDNPLCAAAASVLDTESCDRRPAIGSRDPGDVHRTFSRHGDGGAIGGLGNWGRGRKKKKRKKLWVVHTNREKWHPSSLHPNSCKDWTSSQRK